MSKTIGIVTGFPRSRTCWLSELLTFHGISYAYHEASFPALNAEAWLAKLLNRPEPIVIDCNSSFPIGWEEKVNAAGITQIVWIDRPQYDCLMSWSKHVMPNFPSMSDKDVANAWNLLDRESQAMLSSELLNVAEVSYTDLDNPIYARHIISHLLGAHAPPWDQERFENLCKKNISQNVQKVLESP